ncbi:SMC-Scp complex subunit ScpB [Clostridium manihotivorum]|uniref:Segregation and condensation protein B n=1 Tax=Clostridium manihotivorum TaxID=2320868 RepID=A0A410DSQ1_9CLOT|nr:SMC-Scp complex subunit ScpB [Clostridium manihotivorum]
MKILDKISIDQLGFEEVSTKKQYMSVIESLLFVSGEPLGAKDLARILECQVDFVEEIVDSMTEEYENQGRGIKIISINGMYQLVTKPQNSDYIQKLLKKNTRQSLSQASLESLAIVAYKQPVTRVEIDEIRGVKSDSALQKLLEKNLIKEMGRLDVIGRPIQYGTTEEFLRQFGLEDLKELPSLDLFEEIDNNEEENEEYTE